jgi:hypothetical protein
MGLARVTRVTFVHRETVRFRDIDALGHMNNAVYATLVEQARIGFLSPKGADAENMILARLEIDFRAPVEFGETVEISVQPTQRRDEKLRPGVRAARRRPRRRRGEDRARRVRLRAGALGRASRRVEGAARRLMPVFERTTLDNGLRVLTASMPQVASTTCFVFYAAGSRYETARRTASHFAEHMFFKGTERRLTARDIGVEIDGIGGEFNAFTGKEYTGYVSARRSTEHRARRSHRHAAPLEVRDG